MPIPGFDDELTFGSDRDRRVEAAKSVYDLLQDALRGKASVYHEAPLVAEELDSEPEPDVLVRSDPDERAYRSVRTKPLLVIEVADFSLDYDQGEKASLDAGAGIPEYCVVNLVERVLVVFREPGQGSYPVRSTLDERARLAATVWPELSFDVSAFFPPEGQAPPDTNHLS